jgi:hypothetical protein
MQFKVTEIEFDFEEDNDILRGTDKEWKEYQEMVISDTIGQIWDVDDEDYLGDVISDTTGWCVNSFEYENVSS